MIYHAFSVLDAKADAFGVPYFAASLGLGIRMFTDLCNDPRSVIQRHPEDFHLYQVGTFDDSTGLMEPAQPQSLGMASQFMNMSFSNKDVTQ